MKNENPFQWQEMKGPMLDQTSETRMHVVSHGGGGYVGGQYGGHVSAPTISSYNTQHQRIWIADEVAGKDAWVDLVDTDFAARPGHIIHVINVKHGSGPWRLARIANLTTNRGHRLLGRQDIASLKEPFNSGTGWTILMAVSVILALFWSMGLLERLDGTIANRAPLMDAFQNPTKPSSRRFFAYLFIGAFPFFGCFLSSRMNKGYQSRRTTAVRQVNESADAFYARSSWEGKTD